MNLAPYFHVLVIEYWGLRFICYLVLVIWNFYKPQQKQPAPQLFYEALFNYPYMKLPATGTIEFTEKNSLPGA